MYGHESSLAAPLSVLIRLRRGTDPDTATSRLQHNVIQIHISSHHRRFVSLHLHARACPDYRKHSGSTDETVTCISLWGQCGLLPHHRLKPTSAPHTPSAVVPCGPMTPHLQGTFLTVADTHLNLRRAPQHHWWHYPITLHTGEKRHQGASLSQLLHDLP